MKLKRKLVIGLSFTALLVTALLLPGTSSFSRSGASSLPGEFQQQPPAQSPEGAALYQQKCAMCHETTMNRVPPRFLIARRSAEDVIQTLTTGSMKTQATGLTADQIRQLAIFLTGKQPGNSTKASLNENAQSLSQTVSGTAGALTSTTRATNPKPE
jgi:cytochrome c553